MTKRRTALVVPVLFVAAVCVGCGSGNERVRTGAGGAQPSIAVPDSVLTVARDTLSSSFGVTRVHASVADVDRATANRVTGGTIVPAGAPDPKGHIITMVIDATSAQVLDLGVGDQLAEPLGSLPTVDVAL